MKKNTIVIPADIRPLHWCSPDGKSAGCFRPNKKMVSTGDFKRNPELWEEDNPIWAARLLVGFNVDDSPTWNMKDVIPIVKKRRLEQVGAAGSTFVYQLGLFTHKKGPKTGETVEEEGVQVIIINLPEFETSPTDFRKQMVALAEEIAGKLQQEEVIVELQENGLIKKTIGIVA